MERRRAEEIGNDLYDEVQCEDDREEATGAAVTPAGLAAAKHGVIGVPFRYQVSFNFTLLFEIFVKPQITVFQRYVDLPVGVAITSVIKDRGDWKIMQKYVDYRGVKGSGRIESRRQ